MHAPPHGTMHARTRKPHTTAHWSESTCGLKRCKAQRENGHVGGWQKPIKLETRVRRARRNSSSERTSHARLKPTSSVPRAIALAISHTSFHAAAGDKFLGSGGMSDLPEAPSGPSVLLPAPPAAPLGLPSSSSMGLLASPPMDSSGAIAWAGELIVRGPKHVGRWIRKS